jgi:xanthine/uracil/vitamin C permease (AzgA family)
VTGTLTPKTREALLKAEKPAERAKAALASGAVGTAAGATLGVIAGSAAVAAAMGGPIGLVAGLLGVSLWSQLKDRF